MKIKKPKLGERKVWERQVRKDLKDLLLFGSWLAVQASRLKHDPALGLTTRTQLAACGDAWEVAKERLPRWML